MTKQSYASCRWFCVAVPWSLGTGERKMKYTWPSIDPTLPRVTRLCGFLCPFLSLSNPTPSAFTAGFLIKTATAIFNLMMSSGLNVSKIILISPLGKACLSAEASVHTGFNQGQKGGLWSGPGALFQTYLLCLFMNRPLPSCDHIGYHCPNRSCQGQNTFNCPGAEYESSAVVADSDCCSAI